MPYPETPFKENFNLQLITSLFGEKNDNSIQNIELWKTLKWLCSTPKITSYNVNTLKTNKENVRKAIEEHSSTILGTILNVQFHPIIPNVVIFNNFEVNISKLRRHSREIIVDVDCGAAVLRGAHIYAPGVLGMISGSQINEKVSVYVDVNKNCKKGLLKVYEDNEKVFIGNGIVKMTRQELFGDNLAPNGIAIEITETISGCPSIGDNFLPRGWALLQNLPSVICVHCLDPQPNEYSIDMCASPGNKTVLIAELMQNQGVLIAIDKTPKKLDQLKKRCDDFGAKVHAYQADSTKIFDKNASLDIENFNSGLPVFPGETFDRILLDAPCSSLGKRPQFSINVTEKVLGSYVPLQRKLFETAVKLLKVNGTLVYSTCTITLAENEGMVAWALKTFKCLELTRPKMVLGGPGWSGTSLTNEERSKVQRFGPDDEVDSVGFFIACFVKKCSVS